MNRTDQKLIVFLFGLPAIVLAFFIGLYTGEKDAPASEEPAGAGVVLKDAEFDPFWKAWEILENKYVAAASTTDQEKVWGAIEGLAASYNDPYTVFFPPEESKSFQEDISGNFEGVGMEIGIKNDRLIVVTPIKGSPAERAGVKAGDAIMEIDGTSTVGMSVDVAVKRIRGAKGTTVTLLFQTASSAQPVEKTITRDIIQTPTIETSEKPGGISVIRLYSFTAQSPSLFRTALREFVLSKNDKLILDLRGNPGGYLDASWDMASWFLPSGTLVITEDFGDNRTPKIYRSKGYNIFNDNLKMLILVDGGSASASEILAGALRENGVAELVGTKTFGKGSVQELVPVTDKTSLKVTVARWLTPNGTNLSKDGLVPDYEVKPTEADIAAGKDPILEKAVAILSAMQ